MTRIKTLSLTDRAFEILKDIDNASQYVSRLVEESSLAISRDLIKEKKEAQNKVEVFSKKVEIIDKNIKEQEKEVIEREKMESSLRQKNEKKEVEKRINIKNLIKEGIGREPTEQEIDEYLILFNKGKTNLWKFIEILRGRDFSGHELTDETENKSIDRLQELQE